MRPIHIAAALICAASVLFATPALADRIRVYVKNCYTDDIRAQSFNGGNQLQRNETKNVRPNGGVKGMNCRSQGEGRCWIKADANVPGYQSEVASVTVSKFPVPEGHWVKVYWARGLDGRDKLHADVTAEQPMTCGGETPGPTTHF